MNIKKVVPIFITLVIIGVLIGVYKQIPKTDNTIRVGVILPLSGQYAAIGEGDRNAMLLAKEDLEMDNVELYFEDDTYNARTAVTAYQKLKNINNIDSVVVLSAPSIQALKPLTDRDQIPLIGLGATLVYEKDSVFQLMPSGDTLFVELGRLAGDRYKHIAVVHGNSDLFTTNAAHFIKGLPPHVRFTDVTLTSSTDYRTEVEKIIQTKPDAVTTILPKEDAITFLKALRVLDSKKSISILCDFGTELAVDDYVRAIGKERLEGCVSTNLPDTALPEFKHKFKNRYSSNPVITADYSYDSIGIIGQLAGHPKNTWIKMLQDPMFSYTGKASGLIKFNEDGTRLDAPPTVRIFRDGAFVPFSN